MESFPDILPFLYRNNIKPYNETIIFSFRRSSTVYIMKNASLTSLVKDVKYLNGMEKPFYVNDEHFNRSNALNKIIEKICNKNKINDLASNIISYIGSYMTYEVITFDNYPSRYSLTKSIKSLVNTCIWELEQFATIHIQSENGKFTIFDLFDSKSDNNIRKKYNKNNNNKPKLIMEYDDNLDLCRKFGINK